MAKTLIVKGADFEANALDQVVIEVIECTGISLDKDTLSIVTTGNTGTLVATKTPADTTQPVVWSTSDSDVVTVNNGVVTAVGVGSATITVTCGNYSDSATVTVTEFMDKSILLKMPNVYTNNNNALVNSGTGLTTCMTGSSYNRYGFLASSAGEKYASTINGVNVYPYPIPHNARRIRVTDTGSSAIKKQLINWYNQNTAPSLAGYDDWCALIGSTPLAEEQSTSVVVDIPAFSEMPEIDAFLISFRTYKTGLVFTDADFDEVSVEFLPAAE